MSNKLYEFSSHCNRTVLKSVLSSVAALNKETVFADVSRCPEQLWVDFTWPKKTRDQSNSNISQRDMSMSTDGTNVARRLQPVTLWLVGDSYRLNKEATRKINVKM